MASKRKAKKPLGKTSMKETKGGLLPAQPSLIVDSVDARAVPTGQVRFIVRP